MTPADFLAYFIREDQYGIPYLTWPSGLFYWWVDELRVLFIENLGIGSLFSFALTLVALSVVWYWIKKFF